MNRNVIFIKYDEKIKKKKKNQPATHIWNAHWTEPKTDKMNKIKVTVMNSAFYL